MAVLVRETIDLGAGPQEVEAFLPKRPLSKREREQAERLDNFLRLRVAEIVAEMRAEGRVEAREIIRWYGLGRRLTFVEDRVLVAPEDLEDGHVWKAIRQYCPPELRPTLREGGKSDQRAARREGTQLDHYHHCYLLGKQDEANLSWLTRWTDWFAIVESPGILRDPRVLPLVLEAISRVGKGLRRTDFRRIMKELRALFSTKPVYRDTTVLKDDFLEREIAAAVRRAVG